MKEGNIKKVIIKIFICLLLCFITCFSKNIFAYKITFYAEPKENLENVVVNNGFKSILYENHVSSYWYDTQEYNIVMAGGNSTYFSDAKYDINTETGWITRKVADENEINTFTFNTTLHRPSDSFEGIYEYFHPRINSNYIETGGGQAKYHAVDENRSVKTLAPLQDGVTPTLSVTPGVVYGIPNETSEYQGLYSAPNSSASGILNLSAGPSFNNNIIIMNNNWYRMAIENNVYTSHNLLTPKTTKNMWEKFKNTNLVGGRNLEIYLSSVLRTASSNGKYYENMDTAWKFFESWGKKYSGSPSSTGMRNGKVEAASSAINYYDNKIIIPVDNATNIYVRHTDATSLIKIDDTTYNKQDTMIPNTKIPNAKAIATNGNDWNKMIRYVEQDKNMAGRDKYTESYLRVASDEYWRIANIKYDHETAGSYWNDFLTDELRDEFYDYQCIGVVVGKGDTLEQAEQNLAERLKNLVSSEGVDFKKYEQPEDYSEVGNLEATGIISKNGDKTSYMVVPTEKYQYVVVNFFYDRVTYANDNKMVYVRHVDITGKDKDTIKARDINELVEDGYVLTGKREAKAYINGEVSTRPAYSEVDENGYQEQYGLNNGEKLEIFRDETPGYTCVGTNMVSTKLSRISSLKSKMNNVLNSNNKMSVSETESRIADGTGDEDRILIDFYYVNDEGVISGGKARKRTKVGRLSFYTPNYRYYSNSGASGDTFRKQVNQEDKADFESVTDIIPSGNDLIMSIDNAYLFMLGAINIQKQEKTDTSYLTLTLKQPYKYTYSYYYSECSGCGTTSYSNKGDAKHCSETTGEGENAVTTEYFWSTQIKGPYTITTSHSIDYIYKIPYKYTYYKVKNMRMYTISNIELKDGYDSDGLPLFDSLTHTMDTTDKYKNIFKDPNIFTQSNNKEVFEDTKSTTKTITSGKTFSYNYSEPYEDSPTNIKNSIESEVDGIIETLYGNKVYHRDAAKFKSISESGTIETGSSVKVVLNVNNDRYMLDDTVSNKDIYLVGDGNKSKTTPTLGEPEKNYIDSETNKSNEFDATKIVDLAKYTAEISTKGGSADSGYTILPALPTISVNTQYPKAVAEYYEPSSYKTKVDYFDSKNLNIPTERVNGERYSYGSIKYDLLKENSILNFDVADGEAVNGDHSWTKTQVQGNKGQEFEDIDMNKNGTTSVKTQITRYNLPSIKWNYGGGDSDADVVNVFNPVSFTTKVVGSKEGQLINHSDETLGTQIQKNAEFTIKIDANKKHREYSELSNATGYLDSYYVKFDFDVQNITIDDDRGEGRTYSSTVVSKGTWIGPIYNDADGKVFISAHALADPLSAISVVNQESNRYWVRGVANNAPSIIKEEVKSGRIDFKRDDDLGKFVNIYTDNSAQNLLKTSVSETRHYNVGYYTQSDIKSDSNFVAEATVKTDNISRVFDFKVTDLKDVDWKSIFRRTTTESTNLHSGNVYYSGIRKWNIYTTKYNDLQIRDASEIGANRTRILPVGPYKHTTASYYNAPKMGYRFSFDLKTTGSNDNKKVVITPEFFYISKNGNTYVPSGQIKLFYKNSSNKYVDIEKTKYNLYFVPDDGYRLTFEGTDAAYRFSSSSISKKSVYLGDAATGIELKSNMKEISDNGFVQIWYGEYKLPNSTIAVQVDENGKYNINNPLKNGYIGVKFNIEVKEYSDSSMTTLKRTISYNKNNSNGGGENTSQWDYEGYLGFLNPGNAADGLQIRLDNGAVWDIDNKIYNEIKGTVILYDTDLKASSDYN